MDERKNLAEARALVPLLRSISAEIRERRLALARLEALRHELADDASSVTNEGFIVALQDLDTTIATHRRGIDAVLKELEDLGLNVPSIRPLVVHIPGRTSRGDVMFSWEEGDEGFEKEVSQNNAA
jgi:hypothetical protein